MQGLGGTEIQTPHIEPPLLFCLSQGLWQHRAGSHKRPHRQAPLQGFIHHPPAGFSGCSRYCHQAHRCISATTAPCCSLPELAGALPRLRRRRRVWMASCKTAPSRGKTRATARAGCRSQSQSTLVIVLGAEGMRYLNPKQPSWLPTVRWIAKRCGRANHSRQRVEQDLPN